MPTYFSYPTRVVWGAGSLAKLAEEIRRAGGSRALLVTDDGVVKAGIARRAESLLEAAGIRYELFTNLAPNPTESDVRGGADAYRAANADCLVAVGGGSPLDVARAIRLALHHPPPLSQYDEAAGGDVAVTGELPPLFCVGTTAGPGSEISRSAVVYLPDTGRKTVLSSPRLVATAAIADPELTESLPPHLTAWTGLDAFSRCLEAYVALGDHPLADALALDGIRRAATALPRLLDDGRDLSMRAELMAAALEGAMAADKGLGAAHAIAHGVGAVVPSVHHGLAKAIALPAVCRFNVAEAHPRFARVAEALGEPPGKDDATQAEAACSRVEELCRRCGIPPRLADVGVRREELAPLAERALEDPSHRTNPRPVPPEEMERLIASLL